VCGVQSVCGSNSGYVGRAYTNNDHDYAFGSEPGMIASGVMSPSRGECHTCSPCGLRLAGRKWRSSLARHTNMAINGNGPSTFSHHRQGRNFASSSPALFYLCTSVAHLLSSTRCSSPVRSIPPLCGRSRSSHGPSRPCWLLPSVTPWTMPSQDSC
jgi:hypothetical protein